MAKKFILTKEDKIMAKAYDKKGNLICGFNKSGFNSSFDVILTMIEILTEDNLKKVQYINLFNIDRNLQDDFLINGKRKPY